MTSPPLRSLLRMALASLFVSSSIAQSPYAGDYFGRLFINGTSSGSNIVQIDGGGSITDSSGELSGSVDAGGLISFGANSLGFSTAQIDGNFRFTATGSANTLNYLLEAEKGPGIFSSGSLDAVLTQTNPQNFFSGTTDMVWDGSRFVALNGQSVGISTDGITWETRSTGLTANLTRIAFGNGIYVAVGDANTVATSTDLSTWVLRSSGISGNPNNFADVVFFNGKFRAANITLAYISSPDGISWTTETSPFASTILGGEGRMDVLNGQLVISWQQAGSFANIVFYTSANGTAFTGPSAAVNVGATTFAQAYGSGVYLSAANGGIARSTNGTTWTKLTGLPSTTARSLAFTGSRFVANFLNDKWYHSTDGLTWTLATGANTEAEALVSNGTIEVAAGDAPFYSDDDGSTWTSAVISAHSTSGLADVVAGNGRFLFSSAFAGTTYSPDGITFTSTGLSFQNIAYGMGVFVGFDNSEKRLKYSIDGQAWYIVTDPNGNASSPLHSAGKVVFTGLRFFKGNYVSNNGIDWTLLAGLTGNAGFTLDTKVAGGAGGIWAGGNPATSYVFSEDNGQTFQSRTSGSRRFNDAAYGNGVWVIVGDSGYYRTGTTLAGATERRYSEGPQTPDLDSVIFLGGVFYASLEDNRVLLSTNGVNWTPKTFGANVRLLGGAQSGTTGVLAGTNGTVFVLDLPASFVGPVPVIDIQPPATTNINEGQNLTLGATVSNGGTATYLWLQNDSPVRNGDGVSGADTAQLSLTGVRPEQAGEYRLIASTEAGGVISNVAELIVAPLPVFTTHPASVVGFAGTDIMLTGAVDDVSATFQWQKNGVNMTGEMTNTLALNGLDDSDADVYTLLATNAAGTRSSAPATVSVSEGGGLTPDAAFMGNVPDFATGNETYKDLIRQSDGKVVAIGTFSYTNGGARNNLLRLNANGTLDTTFVGTNFTNLSSGSTAVDSLEEDGSGRIYVGGSYRFPSTGVIVYDKDGNQLAAFPIDSGTVYDLIWDGDGIVAFGSFSQFNGSPARGLARIKSDLTVDTAFQANVPALTFFFPLGAARQSDGKLIVVANSGNTSTRTLLRFNANGTLDATFTQATFTRNSGSAFLYDVTVDDSDNIIVGALADKVNGLATPNPRLHKFGPNGTFDTGFGSALSIYQQNYTRLQSAGNGVVIVGGQTSSPTGGPLMLAINTSDGSLASAPDFGTGPGDSFASVYAIAPVADGLLLGGFFSSFDGTATNGIAYLKGGGSSTPLPFAIARQPIDATARIGQRAVFAVAATGKGLSFQWEKNGQSLPEETGSSLIIESAGLDDAASYRVVVTDQNNAVLNSDAAFLTLQGASQSFAEWASTNLPGGTGSLDGDANGNGIADGFDFALVPGDNGERIPTAVIRSGNDLGLGDGKSYLTLQVRRSLYAGGVAVIPRASTTLAGLAIGQANVAVVGTEIIGGVEITTYRSTFSLADSATGFMNLELVEE